MPVTHRTEALTQPLRFGPGARFELRPAEYRLLVDGRPATLGGRALDLLLVLAARPAELHTKAELLERVWPGLVVEEGNLRVQINTLRRLLGEDAIATVPGRGYRFSAPLHVPPTATAAATPTAAATTPVRSAVAAEHLFGRDADLARLAAALKPGSAGCVTLLGTPGVGKSSLARAAAASWPGPNAWVDLAPLPPAADLAAATASAQVATAIARALGGQIAVPSPHDDGVAQVMRLLPADRPVLLVLDNAEHLLAACAEWVRHLSAARQAVLLVTSQVPLGVAGEQLQRVQPLEVLEGVEGPNANEGALAMLIARIRAADSRFEPASGSVPLLASLCRQLDGLPLALEMAAARVPLMGLQAVHDALAERFALLSRGRRDAAARHRTLLGALDWSYRLLEPAEQRLFRALGVFAGGFTLELAITLATDEHVGRWDVVDGLATLVEHSLVSVSAEDPPRYRLLETLRALAMAKARSADAADAQEWPSLRRRHAATMLALWAGNDAPAHWLADMQNVREAFNWAREHDLASAALLCARAARAVTFTVWRQEVTDWMVALKPAMRQPPGLALPAATQALWWSMLAHLLGIRNDPEAAPAARRAVQLWRPLGNPTELQIAVAHWVRAFQAPAPELDEACAALREAAAGDTSAQARLRMHGALAVAARVRGDTHALLACNEQELQAARELGWHAKAQAAENNICITLARLGRYGEAAERTWALLGRIDASGDGDSNGNLPWVLNALIEALVGLGRLEEAQMLVARTVAAGRRFGTSVIWLSLLLLLTAQQRADAAARLAGYASRLWTASEGELDAQESLCIERALACSREHLGAAATQALEAEGRGLDEAAVAALVALA